MTSVVIDPEAIYQEGDVRIGLNLTSATLIRARRNGLLRFSRLGQRILYRGQWIIDWLEASSKQKNVEVAHV